MTKLSHAFEHTLKDMYFAENAIIKALPGVIEAVKDRKLRDDLSAHLTETKGQVKTLERVFKSVGAKPAGEKCDAIVGLIKETDGIIDSVPSSSTRDAMLLGCCQAVEHYEIARYGTLREWAKSLDNVEAHDLLSSILDQEKAANSKLTHLAVSAINSA